MNRAAIQSYLKEHDLDGWLLADFHGYNTVFTKLLNINAMLTRRAFLFIPAGGNPVAIVHAIEVAHFREIDASLITYSGYQQLESELAKLVPKGAKVAMEYSPGGRLPYIAKVDAGTIEMVRALGVEIISSSDLVAYFQTRLSNEQIESHRTATSNLFDIKTQVFALISERLRSNKSISEYEVVQFMLTQFNAMNMETDHSPNCSFAGNAGNPHYDPTADKCKTLERGNIVLIDLWGKLKKDNSVFGDIAWVAFAGTTNEIPEKFIERFSVIAKARDTAIKFLSENIGQREVHGYEVDTVCRKIVVEAGYGEAFTHRTGHSIMTSVHGDGPNIDNLETEDRRILQTGHLFSIEPGLYFDDCGFRTEIDALITDSGVEINPLPLQNEIVMLG